MMTQAVPSAGPTGHPDLTGPMPAHHAKRFYRRYAHTLLAVSAPAMVAGLVAGWMFSDATPKAQPTDDLAQRVEAILMVQDQMATLDEDHQVIRTSAMHQPLSHVGEAVR